ncbi:uncharacterized protein G2W53_022424 [Senna tora]|uniref:DRBM domain-containing protein n=1 Tax=Senna tora TaxID=362788 RepID=A0A834TLY9_9FABA|nr:uncharacterized protein G2W53_022424 [Senna tora]
MAPSNVCPTDDAIQALLEYLVFPMLPAKSSVRDNPTSSQQQSVANQVHSVVLLYNYYHRRQNPELPFLAFDEFCKLAVVLKPTLLSYMDFMQQSGETELNDVEKQLSVTEKMIMDACDICTCLDASKNVPNTERWPISKVTVLLIDSKKENCFLLIDSITKGVWSMVEKDVDISSQSSEDSKGTKSTLKKRRVIRKPNKEKLNVDEAGLLQVGYSAVKEAAGINQTDIVLLESYTVYSHSKEKTTSLFYIMQCPQLINQEVFQAPIKDVIRSLQGPLIQKSSSSWTVTSVIEYFHLLPYSEIISQWLSRETFSNSLQDLVVAEKSMTVSCPEVIESYVTEDMSIDLDSKPSSNNCELLKEEENKQSCTDRLSGSSKEPKDMDVEKCSISPFQMEEKSHYVANSVQIVNDQETKNMTMQNYSEDLASTLKVEKVDKASVLITEDGTNYVADFKKSCVNTTSGKDTVEEYTLVPSPSNSIELDLEKFQKFLASKGKILSQTSLAALVQKRNKLALQQRLIEDDIAMCDKKIQTILTGGEAALELKIESIIEGCNDICARNQERTSQNLEDHFLPPDIKRKRLSEAVLITQSPCQELDGVCHENNWILPTYRVSQSDGGFQANVTVKGMDFGFSCEGNVCFRPQEARESAAAQTLAKLRSMSKSSQ